MRRLALLALAGATHVLACAPTLVRPTADHVVRAAAAWPGTTLADLERGRTLYAARCGSCHVAPLPESRSAVMWPHIVADMVQKKKVAASDELSITRFLVAVTTERAP